ncbi:signal peptidase I [candidate division KSB1 bacterium]|nr:signal peptidase I [candidate division KSB1 bacterium]
MKSRKKSAFREYVEAFGVALIAALILRALVIQAFRIPTGSMKDTLLVGDFLLVNKVIYGSQTPTRIAFTDIEIPHFRFPSIRDPKRGDIIVFKYPLDEKLDYIKRCIGVAGDTLEFKDWHVYVNGHPEGKRELIKEREYDKEHGAYFDYYRITLNSGIQYTVRHYSDERRRVRHNAKLVVPPGHFFMMGDNRDNSQDSRYWGFMPGENLVGRALVIYWSWDHVEPLWQIWEKIRWDRIFNIIR